LKRCISEVDGRREGRGEGEEKGEGESVK